MYEHMTKAELIGRLERQVEKNKQLEEIVAQVKATIFDVESSQNQLNVKRSVEINLLETPRKRPTLEGG